MFGARVTSGDDTGSPVGRTVARYSIFLAALIPFFLWAGRSEWFQSDDWDYLVTRKAGTLDDLLRPHNGHWEAIPLLVYRTLWTLFGLTYRPFQLVSILLSLAGAALLLTVMLRARTRPWLAVALTTLVVLFGDAQPNVALRVTSITFVGFAIPLGLTDLILADHDGPLNRRDWLGLAAGMIALLCSNVATVMIVAVGLAMLAKRGWRIALFHVGPPLIVFMTWYVAKGRNDNSPGDPAHLHPLSKALHFASILMTGTLESLTRTNTVGGLLLIVFVVGLALTLWRADAARRRDAVVPCALLIAGFGFAVETGLGRADLLDSGAHLVHQGHYMDAVAYLLFPALAFLAEEITRRRHTLAPILATALVVAIAVNIHELLKEEDATRLNTQHFRDTVLLIPRLPAAKVVPGTERPFFGTATPITIDWLLASLRDGKLPEPHRVTPAARGAAILRISLTFKPAKPSHCEPFAAAVTRRLGSGDAFSFRGAGIRIDSVENGQVIDSMSRLTSKFVPQWNVVNVGLPLTLRFRPVADRDPPALICN